LARERIFQQFVFTVIIVALVVMESSLFLYSGTSLAQFGLNWTRHAYRESPAFRKVIEESGGFSIQDPTPQQKESTMKKLFAAFPSTVSEMIHEQGQPHGMIFKACMMAGSVLSLRADMGALTPTPDTDCQKILNVLRSAAFFCGGFLISLAPSPHSVFELFARHAKAGTKKLDPQDAEIVRITAQQNKLHSIAALITFFITPVTEAIAVGLAAHRFSNGHDGWIALSDLRNPPSISGMLSIYGAAGIYGFLLPVRALNIFTSFFSLKKMMNYFGTGFLSAPQKCFWTEWSLCVSAVRTFQLAACASWFADRTQVSSRSLPLLCGLGCVGLQSAFEALKHNTRTIAVLIKDIEYSTADYACAYDEWRSEYEEQIEKKNKAVAEYEKVLSSGK